MRLIRINFICFGLLTGAAVALAVTLPITVREWIANPGGIFRGPEGTNWIFVRDLAWSWLRPTFGYAASISAIGHLMVTAMLSAWKNRSSAETPPPPRPIRDILTVASPILILGIAGSLVGAASIAGGLLINLGYVLAILLGGLLLRRQGSGWRRLGLMKPASRAKTALLGIAAWAGALLVFMATQIIVFGLLTMLEIAPPGIDQSRFNPIEGNLSFLILMLVLAWTTIAFGEELFYRAFLITRLIDHAAVREGPAIFISGAVFGIVHFAEGPVGILSNGAFGVLFGWIYIRSRRNLWITIIGHGLLNTFRFVILYAGAA